MHDTRDRLFTATFVLLLVAELAYFTSVGIAIYALPLYVTGPIGSTEAGAGFAFGAFAITALLCRPLAGRASDLLGRRTPLIFGGLLAAASMALFPYADTLAAVVVLRLVQGVAEAAFMVSAFALLADIAPPSRMGEAVSYNSLGLYLGIALGPPLGEVLLERWGYDVVWLGAAALGVLVVALAAVLAEPDRDHSGEGHGKLIHRPGIPAAIGFCTSLAAIGGFLTFAALHSEQVGMRNTSVALFLYGAVVVCCRLVFARVPDRVPPLRLGAGSLFAIAAGLTLVALWRDPTGLLVGVVVMAVGVAFSTPAFFSAIFATASPRERGAASGTATIFIDLGLGFGPIALGLVADAAGIPWAFGVAAGLAVLGATWTLRLARSATPRAA